MSKAPDLISAIHHDRLPSVAAPEARAACQAIAERMAAEVGEVVKHLAATGIEATVEGDPSAPAQRHVARIVVGDAQAGHDAAAALRYIGYSPWGRVDGAAGIIHRRFRSEITVARTTDLTVAIGITWPRAPRSITGRLPPALVPNENDFDLVALPTWLWPVYFAARPLRLVAERLGLRPRSPRSLGPFLSTPLDLIPGLLDLVDVETGDVVVDLGCGDGRILIEAAALRGCRGVGVESNLDLVEQARKSVAERGLSRQVEIIHKSIDGSVVSSVGSSIDGSVVNGVDSTGPSMHRDSKNTEAARPQLPGPAADGTVFFVFVPADAASSLVAGVLAQAKSGSRVVAHEQQPLPDPPTGYTSAPLIIGQGVTVAHHWMVE
jgi:hypothetical protein